MDQETTSTLLIYVQTNRSFIEQKLYDTFKIPCLKEHELKDLQIDEMIKTIEQIFRFGAQNPSMRVFFQKIPKNIQAFIDQKYRNTSQLEDLIIEVDTLVEIVYACVRGAAQPKKKVEEPVRESDIKFQVPAKVVEKEVVRQLIQKAPKQKTPEKPKKFFIVPKPKTPEKKNFIQKFEMPEKKMPARYLMNLKKAPKKEVDQEIPDIMPQPVDLSYLERNRKNIETRLEHLYKHYCSQQQNLGTHATFDRIKSECEHMTVGKFLLFCKITGLFKGKEISKEFLMAKFRKVGDGKKEISFEVFKDLLKEVDEEYIRLKTEALKDKEKDSPNKNQQEKQGEQENSNQSEDQKDNQQNKDVIVPTFEARLLLHNHLDFKKHKKTIDLPFCTRERQGRELKQYHTLSVSDRYGHPSVKSPLLANTKKNELTSHSGRFPKDLLNDVQQRVRQQSEQNHKKGHHRKSSDMDKKSKIIRLNNLGQFRMPGMEWIMKEDDSDQTFLKDYKLRDIVGDLKKRVTDVERMEKNKNY